MVNKTPISNKEAVLSKVLDLWDSVAIVVGIVIGVGIFRVPAEIAGYLPFPKLIILAWLLGGIFSMAGALCYAELSSSFPETGGDYVYIKESYGKLAAFLYAWAGILVVRTGVIATVALIFAEYSISFFSLHTSLVKAVAIFIIATLSFVNILSVKKGKSLLNISVMAKIAALAGIIIFGIMFGKGEIKNFQHLSFSGEKNIMELFGLAMVPVLWTYGGWHENTFMTGETKDAQKVLPLALITGTIIVTMIYSCMNTIYIYLVPVDRMAHSTLIASDIMKLLCGKEATKIVEGLVMLSAFGSLNATIITSSRITYAMGRDNPLFRYIGEVHTRFRTPARAITANAIWSSILIIIWGTFSKLLFFTGFLVWFFFAIIASGLIILRYKYPRMDRPFSVWGYPVTPVIFIVVCIWLTGTILLHYPLQSVIGAGLMLSGVPIYFISKRFL